MTKHQQIENYILYQERVMLEYKHACSISMDKHGQKNKIKSQKNPTTTDKQKKTTKRQNKARFPSKLSMMKFKHKSSL